MRKMQQNYDTKILDGKMERAEKEIVLEYEISEDKILHKTEAVKAVFGLPMEIEHGQDYLIRYGVVQPESAKAFSTMFRKIRMGEPYAECIVKARSAKGKNLWMQITLTTIFEDGKPIRAVGVLKDITEGHEAALQWNNALQRREFVLKAAIIYYQADLTDRKILTGLTAFLESLGLPYTENYDDALNLLIDNVVFPEERMAVKNTFSIENLLECHEQGKDNIECEYRRLISGDVTAWVRGTAYLSEDPVTQHIILGFYVSDISDLKQREESMMENLERDPLTGLYNLESVQLLIERATAGGKAIDKEGTLFVIRFENFHKMNENLGSYFWNALLSEMAQHLKDVVSKDAIVGRSGDAEFLVYSRNIKTEEQAKKKTKELQAMFCDNRPELLRGIDCPVIVGAVIFPPHGDTFKKLYDHADTVINHCQQKHENAGIYHLGMARLEKKDTSMVASLPDAKKPFSSNVMEYVFRILHESKDSKMAIEAVLELMIRQFGFKRGYIYNMEEKGVLHCIYDCTVESGESTKNKSYIMTPEVEQGCKTLFRKNDFHVFHGDQVPNHTGMISDTRFVYGIQEEGNLRGIIGFDQKADAEEVFTVSQRDSLQSVAQLLALFLTGSTTNQELWETSLLLQGVVDGMKNYTYVIDPLTHVIKYANQNTQQKMEDVRSGQVCYEVLRNKEEPCEDCPIDRMVSNGTIEDQSEMYLDQCGMWARINASLISVTSGQTYGVFTGFDFSEEKHKESQDNEHLSDFTLDVSLYDALSLSTDDYIIMCNMATKQFYFPKKMVEEFELPGQVIVDAIPMWTERIHEDDKEDFLQDIDEMFMGKTDTHSQDYRIRDKDNVWTWIRARGHVERNEKGDPTIFVVVLTKLGKKSKVDALTGLLDKYEFEVTVRAHLAGVEQGGAILLLGLDNFRYINNVYGWDFGDFVLKESALRLHSALPERAHLYRLDGDKFGVFFPGADLKEVETYFQDLSVSFRNNRQFGEHRYRCTLSAGCAVFEEERLAFSTLFKRASYALEFAKGEGKNRLIVYDEATMSGNERVMALLSALHDSVEQDCKNFAVAFQPQVEPKSLKICSAEALLRWTTPEFGSVSPVEFIPLLEQTGLIHRVGRWVLERSAEWGKQWRQVDPDFTVSVNLSYIQLQEQNFIGYLEKQIQDGFLDPSIVHLEITESCIADGSRSLEKIVESLRNLGFKVEMDDFGTGYSSLEILKNNPADVVKIDRAFVQDITHSDFDVTFITFIVALCHSANIHVCVEGVETWEEYNLIESMGIDLIQGYLFGKPQWPDEFEKLLRAKTEELKGKKN